MCVADSFELLCRAFKVVGIGWSYVCVLLGMCAHTCVCVCVRPPPPLVCGTGRFFSGPGSSPLNPVNKSLTMILTINNIIKAVLNNPSLAG